MLFHSYEFLFVFLPVTLAGYSVIRSYGGHQWALGWLTLASLFFYGYWNPVYLLLLLASISFNYAMGLALGRFPKQGMTLLTFGVVVNVGVLGYFKYTNFLVDNLNALTGFQWAVDRIVLPLGISFITFQKIGYLVDTYRSRKPITNLLHFSLFVSFFPQLISGPIVHYKEIVPQFAENSRLRITKGRMAVGLSIFGIGLFKKVILADTLGEYYVVARDAISSGHHLTFFEAWAAVITAAWKVYFDFSAYGDMAIGLGLLFGIVLPLNFYSPFKATSIIEFWRRWNITLMRFLKDYIYIPLGGGRHGLLRQMAALMITMLLCGLWHGAEWSSVVWGGLAGVTVIINLLLRKFGVTNTIGSGMSRVLISRFVVLITFLVPVTFFFFPPLGSGWSVLKAMFDPTHIALPSRFAAYLGDPASASGAFGIHILYESVFKLGLLAWLFFSAVLIYGMPNSYELFRRFLPDLTVSADFQLDRASTIRWRPTPVWATFIAALVAVALMSMTEVKAFYYFQF